MPPDAQIRALLWDIDSAADAVLRFTKDLTPEAYEGSELVTAAVERKFEIIGEALAKMLKIAPDMAEQIPDVRQIVAFRAPRPAR